MIRHRLTYNIGEVAPYFNWAYYYFAWQVRDVAEQVRLRREATQILSSLDGHYRVKALFALGDANADGDDIVFEGKNKDFGAYEMRKKSDGRHNKAMIIVVIAVVVVVAVIVVGVICFINKRKKDDSTDSPKA